MLQHALELARRGLRVFPCHSVTDGECTCRDIECGKNAGKHPRVKDWQDAATTDETIINAWWKKWPDANPAVATGIGSGCFIVDVDPRNDGFTNLEQLLADKGELPETFSVATGGGGAHIFYRHPDADIENPMRRSWRKQIAKGVDVKGDGGYVIGAGALHFSGKHYEVELDLPIARAPAWLVELASKPKVTAIAPATPWAPVDHGPMLPEVRGYARRIVDEHAPAVEGNDGSTPTLVVAILLYKGLALPDDSETRAIYDRYLARCTPPWTDEEQIRHKIESAKESDKRLGFKLGEFKVWRWGQKRRAKRAARPVVKVTADVGEVARGVIDAIAARDDVFVYNGVLTDVVIEAEDVVVDGVSRKAHAPRLRAMPGAHLQTVISDSCTLEKWDARSKDWVHCRPPDWLVSAVIADGRWKGVKKLVAVNDFPVILADGRIIHRYGYDEASGIYMVRDVSIAVPDQPGRREAALAAVGLLDLVNEFDFFQPTHQSAWLAAVLTLFGRHAFEGCAPLMLFDASSAASGKSRLVDLASCMTFGRKAAGAAFSGDDAEIRKTITAAAMAGDKLMLLDNIENGSILKAPALDLALTREDWDGRILGTNQRYVGPLTCTWFATGNNLGLGGDLARRCLHVRLEPTVDHPELRSGFKYPFLLEHAKEHRDRYASMALTMLRAFVAAGCPSVGLPEWGSFEAWSKLIRGAIVWAGLPDPGETRDHLRQTMDRSRAASVVLVDEIDRLLSDRHAAWQRNPDMHHRDWKSRTVSARGLLAASMEKGREALKETLEELTNIKSGQPSPAQVGFQLRKLMGKRFGGKWLQQFEPEKDKGSMWTVLRDGDLLPPEGLVPSDRR